VPDLEPPGAAARSNAEFWGEGRSRGRRPRRPLPDGPLERVRDALSVWLGDARAGLALLVACAVVAGVVWYQVGVGGADDPPPSREGVTGSTSAGTTPGTSDGGAPTPAEARDVLVVHVAGAVTQPGVVELQQGSRVIDAVEAAGGAVADADLDRLNLAAKLADGQRVLVQRVGEPAVPSMSPDGSSAPGEPEGGGLINVNTASAVELEQLPGIGPALAAAIISERQRRGGFRSVQELRDVRGIGEKRFADIADLVTV